MLEPAHGDGPSWHVCTPYRDCRLPFALAAPAYAHCSHHQCQIGLLDPRPILVPLLRSGRLLIPTNEQVAMGASKGEAKTLEAAGGLVTVQLRMLTGPTRLLTLMALGRPLLRGGLGPVARIPTTGPVTPPMWAQRGRRL